MMSKTMLVEAPNDAELVVQSLTGNKDAFGQIVARYQSLICSLAYSATGSLSQSEDLAQETFVTAWNQLRSLREPEKLRAWLCRISRNLTYDALREQGREPSHRAELLEEIQEAPAPGPQPVEQAISNEEAAILWRSLKNIPEIYREPLVLFYREHQSIETVAHNLDLSEDVVKQRLSRGRKVLQEEVLAFIAGALTKSAPGKTFTLGVVAALALTATPAKAAAVGATAAKAGATAKAGVTLGSALGFVSALGSLFLVYKSQVEQAKSPRERQFLARIFWLQAAALFAVTLILVWILFLSSHVYDRRLAWVALLLGQLAVVLPLGIYARRRRRQIQIEDGTRVGPEPMTREERQEHFDRVRRNGSKWHVYLYLGLACNMISVVIIEFMQVRTGKHKHLLYLELLLCFICFLFVQAWRYRPR